MHLSLARVLYICPLVLARSQIRSGPPTRLTSRSATMAMTTQSGSFSGEVMLVKKLSEHASMPTRGSEHAAGFDLAAAHDTVIPKGGKGIVKTDLSIVTPPNTYARIAPRSGLAVKKMIDVGAGVSKCKQAPNTPLIPFASSSPTCTTNLVVDHDYRGPVGVVLFNFGSEDFVVAKGDRVAQLVLERISMATVEEVEELPDSVRGAAGFGSTGVAGAKKQKLAAPFAGTPEVDSAVLTGETVGSLLKFVNSLEEEDLKLVGGKPEDVKKSLRARAIAG
ncbi:unnamed protein product, partial [Chrysoparadoxa australica]